MKTMLCYAMFFLFFFILNSLIPLSFGDDYVYSFVWEGHSIYEPLSENAIRVSSFKDLFSSQVLHYFTWSGRVVSHTLAQFFLWTGKGVFNVCNAFVSIALVAEIYGCSHKGTAALKAKAGMLCGAFFALWAFTPGFSHVFLWLDGACNYLWTTAILLGFLAPYIRKYYLASETLHPECFFSLLMFLGGVIAGCTNENTVCWVIPILICFIFTSGKNRKNESWLYFGLAGLVIGYALLMFAPGNTVRLLAEKNGYDWFTWSGLAIKVALLILLLLYFQLCLWFFNLRSLRLLRGKEKDNTELGKDVTLAKIMCLVSFCMTFSMLFSPNFLPRSAFPGSVFLMISAFILLRIQDEYAIPLISERVKNCLCVVGMFFFLITTAATFYGSYDYGKQVRELVSYVESSVTEKNTVINVGPIRPVNDVIHTASYYHLISFKMSEDEKDWRNVAFARYYGIKGIRMVKRD
ncbi:MAG: hypothetical protein IJM03_00300 [Treponema sp.]|nr:hypothetical protein [Treponema sp.]